MANIKEIAKIAGVSVTTVSRVLNNHPYVKEDKRRAVLETIDRLNYSRNINALHLLKGRTQIIGVILPMINHSYFGAMMEGIAGEALKSGYQLMVSQTSYQPEEEQRMLEMMRNKQIDGVIICSRALPLQHIEAYNSYGPIVLCEDIGAASMSSVFLNHYNCFQEVIRHLWNKGYRTIGYSIGRTEGTSSSRRYEAYCDIHEEFGISVNPDWIYDHCLDIEDGVLLVRHMLEQTNRPSALVVTSAQVAAGILLEAGRQGLKIPEDLALISFDNMPISEVLGISTMDNGIYTMGSSAMTIIDELVRGTASGPITREISFQLIERSTA
ncbi:LacI family DNA-binding transcriptional regulator [Paenibacillus sp. YPG26]|uniref:LacI family DNA-binding transcriptional regulator n=1 Tax=Paenibacillus sp. YPG26 TaxID=2878915 RepID=UPI0020412330|nr:LacI family DNA-binding transcriptional regulator [Paenibacillus sp. YPG26]USB32921.1 LacI family DNA-binding transcriptional regulator [Paenibacillus sp. YPG26]